MANHESLPVYKTLYNALEAIYVNTSGLSYEIQFSLAERIKTGVVDVMFSIYKANLEQDNRVMYILDARDKMVNVTLRWKLLYDLEYINVDVYNAINDKFTSAIKQLISWQSYSQFIDEKQNVNIK